MGPLAIGGIAMGGLGALGGMAGLMQGGPDYAKMAQFLQRYYGPQMLGKNTQQIYQQGLGNAGFQAQLQGINQAGNQFNQNLGAMLGGQGMGGNSVRSGVGTMGQAAAPSLSTKARGDAYGNLFNQSQATAMQQMMAQMQALQGLNPGQTWGQSFAPLLGGAMQAGGQYLGGLASRPR